MQLEDEVQSLQGLTTQQQARLGALQQENSLLSKPSSPLRLLACAWPKRASAAYCRSIPCKERACLHQQTSPCLIIHSLYAVLQAQYPEYAHLEPPLDWR